MWNLKILVYLIIWHLVLKCATHNTKSLSTAEDKKEREKDLIRSEMIPIERKNLTFWNKLYELQYKMLFNNQENVAGHMYASDPLDWLFLKRGVAYWISANSNVSPVTDTIKFRLTEVCYRSYRSCYSKRVRIIIVLTFFFTGPSSLPWKYCYMVVRNGWPCGIFGTLHPIPSQASESLLWPTRGNVEQVLHNWRGNFHYRNCKMNPLFLVIFLLVIYKICFVLVLIINAICKMFSVGTDITCKLKQTIHIYYILYFRTNQQVVIMTCISL